MHFFKVFLPQFSAQRMLVPKAFTNRLESRIPEKITLRRRSGRCWHMKAISCGRSVYLQDSWQKFVQDNSIETADILVFSYHGHHILTVTVMGRSACEKEESVVLGMEEEEEEEQNLGLRGGREAPDYVLKDNNNSEDMDISDDNIDEDGNDDDYEEEEEEEDNDEDEDEDEDEKKSKSNYEDCEDCEYHDKEQDQEEEEDKAKMEQRSKPKKGHGNKKHNRAQKGEGKVRNRKAARAARRQHDFEPGRYIQTKNPYFIAQRTARTALYVPRDLVKDYKLKLHKMIDFKDPNGRKWPGELTVWKDGRAWIRGWELVCRRNNVKPNDVCICELPLGQGVSGRVIKVHIVREAC